MRQLYYGPPIKMLNGKLFDKTDYLFQYVPRRVSDIIILRTRVKRRSVVVVVGRKG